MPHLGGSAITWVVSEQTRQNLGVTREDLTHLSLALGVWGVPGWTCVAGGSHSEWIFPAALWGPLGPNQSDPWEVSVMGPGPFHPSTLSSSSSELHCILQLCRLTFATQEMGRHMRASWAHR